VTTPFTQALRDFWDVPTLEQAQHQRVTVPPQPEAWDATRQDKLVDQLFADVLTKPGSRLLDYGCGVGRLVRPLASRGHRIVAVDVSPKMLKHCADYCTGLNGIECALSDGWGVADVPPASFDGAYSFYVFQHMPSTEMARAVLADLYRVLRPGGWCKVHTVDIGTDAPVKQVGFHGERQTAKFILESAQAAGFRHLRMEVTPDESVELVLLTAKK
jgi:cyclopropane fatty-acyl-phospholipid synthase-like methyltransferase